MEKFRQCWGEVSGELLRVRHTGELKDGLRDLFVLNEWNSAVAEGGVLSYEEFHALSRMLDRFTELGDETLSRADEVDLCSSVDVGISQVYAIITDTGTLVLALEHWRQGLSSLLPPVHVAVALDCLHYETLDEFLSLAEDRFSYTFVTGPSRTADIEKQIVLGAHGPKRVIVCIKAEDFDE